MNADGTIPRYSDPDQLGRSFARNKLYEAVASHVAVQIVGGEFQPSGGLPPEADLAEKFGVSKPVVREAVQRLQSAGLIQVRHGKRTAVLPEREWDVLDPLVFEAYRAADRSAELLTDLYAVRALLEPPSARWTAERASDEQIAGIVAILDELDVAAQVEDQEAMLSADRRFHMAIIETAGSNAVLHAIFRDLQALLAGSWANPLPKDQLKDLRHQHAAIAESIASGDGAGAEEAMRDHIEWAARSDLTVNS